MKKSEIRILDMLRSVRQHGQPRAGAFPASWRGHDLYATVAASIVNIERYSAEQAVHVHAYREKTTQKSVADEALHDSMETISRTARSMSRSFPGVEEKFRLPSKRDGETWIATARGFTIDAEPLSEEFVSRGMLPDFIDDLKARILVVAQAAEGQSKAWAARVKSTANVVEETRQGLEAVRELDAIVRNVYASNEAELTAWESASHVERAPRHAEEEEEEPPAEPAPAQS